MGSGRGLAQVVMEMRNEIKKLEPENKTLHGEAGQPESGRENAGPSLAPAAFAHRLAAEETSSLANLRRNASAPTLERQYKENIIMTVRRYSISPNTWTVSRKTEKLTCGQETAEAREGRDPEGTRRPGEKRGDTPALLDPPAREDITPREKLTNRRSLQEYVHKNRAKVKTVTFLLPHEPSRPGQSQSEQEVI